MRQLLNYENEKIILIGVLEERKRGEEKLSLFSEWDLGSEEKVVTSFYEYFRGIVNQLLSNRLKEVIGKERSDKLYIAGFNNLKFDIPLLIQKGVEYKVGSIAELNSLWYNQYIIDYLQVLYFMNGMKFKGLKLNQLRNRVSRRLPVIKETGANVIKYYKAGEYKKIEEYATLKLNTIKGLRRVLDRNRRFIISFP